MSDPLPTGPSHALDAASDADREAKIEQLLLTGLDRYFAAEYEQAINVWTRALFLDRNHARARAYIERARTALAERQRESEELLHSGVAAFERGDGDEARRLLHSAINRGAPSDEALAVLERLNRLDRGASVPARPAIAPLDRPAAPRGTAPSPRARNPRVLVSIAAAVLVASAGLFLARSALPDWRLLLAFEPPADAAAVAPEPVESPLPLPRRAEVAVSRARALQERGRLRDALAALDGVHPTDPERVDADRMRADIQRQLLALVAPRPPVGGQPGTEGNLR